MKKYKYSIKGLDCANCALKIEEHLSKNKDFKNVSVNFSTLKLILESETNPLETIQKLVKEIEPNVKIVEENNPQKKDYKNIIRFIIGVIFALVGFFTKNQIVIILAYIVLLMRTSILAFQLLVKSKTINENFLITISSIGAYLVGEHMEGLMVITLYELGKILEEKAISNSRKSISDLMDMKVDYALLENGEVVTPETLKINDIIVVKPGEKVPIDGIIIEGKANLDISSLTGESKMKLVTIKDEILSGSINKDGILKIKVTTDYENSTVNKILELVENATDKKAKTETFVNKASKIYTPIVLFLAILVGLFLPFFSDISYSESIYRALIFLVISCPCAIAISVPLSYFSGIGRASKDGILIKGSDYLDSLKDIKEVIFDKTGTLTKGEFGVTNIILLNDNYQKEDILYYTCLGESFSNHPLSQALLKLNSKELNLDLVKDFKEESGKGISYKLKNEKIKIGNHHFVGYQKTLEDGTNIFVSINDKIVGIIVLKDILKQEAKEIIQLLKNRKIHTRMFTGDNASSALEIGKKLSLDDVKYEMLPMDKYHELEELIEKYPKNEKVCFVGDGINDSPVLALSDIGISMGGIGSSAAIEASDVVIMTDNLLKIDRAISISKITNKIIQQNLFFALTTKILILILSVFGIGGMWQAIFADVGVTLLTILNTLRILKS